MRWCKFLCFLFACLYPLTLVAENTGKIYCPKEVKCYKALQKVVCVIKDNKGGGWELASDPSTAIPGTYHFMIATGFKAAVPVPSGVCKYQHADNGLGDWLFVQRNNLSELLVDTQGQTNWQGSAGAAQRQHCDSKNDPQACPFKP